jgi:hypothetical protein
MTTVTEQLAAIKPGKNYPARVSIRETCEGKPVQVEFLLQSYAVGMYCAIYFNRDSSPNTQPHQTGDHNNCLFVRKLKRDVAKAVERGAVVEIGEIRLVKTEFGT